MPPTVDDFNWFRKKYAELSSDDVRDFYRSVGKQKPKFNLDQFVRFFEYVPTEKVRVIETGGYDGLLAKEILERFDKINFWRNFEVMRVEQQCTDDRYTYVIPDKFIWNLSLKSHYDVWVSSHMIEHISFKNLCSLFEKVASLGIRFIALQAPLRQGRPFNWHNQTSTHILRISWDRIEKEFKKKGFEKVSQLSSNQFRAFGI